MNKTVIQISCCLICVISIFFASCKTRQVTGDDVSVFIQQFEKQAEYLNRQKNLCYWELATQGKSDSLDYYNKQLLNLYTNAELYSLVKRYRSVTSDVVQSRKLDLLNRQCLKMEIDYQNHISVLADSLLKISRETIPIFEGRETLPKELDNRLRVDDNRFRREEAIQSKNQIGNSLSDGIITLAQLRNQAAQRIGFNTYYDIVLAANGINKSTLNAIIDELDDITAGPYKELIDSLKNAYSFDNLAVWDIPYCFRRKNTVSKQYFLSENHMRLARQTFNGLGFKIDALPIYFIPSNEYISNRYNLCVSTPDDIRIIYQDENGIEGLDQLLTQISQSVYAANIDKIDYSLSRSPAPCFESGINLLLSDIIKSDKWLRKYAGIPDPAMKGMSSWIEFSRIYNIRRMIVQAKFEEELYKNPFGNLNETYEELHNNYLGLRFHPNENSWAANYNLIAHPVSIQNEIIGECIAAQIGVYLIDKYGSVIDNQHSREYIVQNYFRFGAREEWQVLLERGSGEVLNAKYFAEYHGI